MNFFGKSYYLLIRGIFIRTCLFFIAGYFIFHFINGNISYAALENKRDLVIQKENLLNDKKKELEFRFVLINKIKDAENNIDLIDELVRLKLGYSSKGETVYKAN